MIVKWLLVNCLLYFPDYASPVDLIINETLKRHLRSNGARVGLNADGPQFTLDGRPITILSGAIHYFRVPRAYWWDRLAALKSAGLNTVETYVAWNVHEEYEGQFDYSGEYDLIEFIKTAKQVDLFVIVRPGPYICAEWEFGGMPAWLLSDASMSVRTKHRGFMSAAERYLNDLLQRLLPYQYSRGGPIVAVQIENEYQTYGRDIEYMRGMRAIFDKNNVQELMFTSDGENLLNRMGSDPLPGILTAVNFQANPEKALNLLSTFQPGKPLFVAEFWSGWFDHWGEKHNSMNQATFAWLVDEIFKRNASINFYMFHGGTNFGFMNGANGYHKDGETYPEYKPTETTYDYNAPLSEQGEADPKFFALQQLVKKYFPQTPIYSLRQKIRRPLGRVYASEFLSLTDILDHVISPIGQISTPVYVEYVCHLIGGKFRAEAPKATSEHSKSKTKVAKLSFIFKNKSVTTKSKKPCKAPFYGFVAYRHDLTEISRDTSLTLSGIIGDRMQILVDGEVINTIYSNRIQQPTTVKVPVKATSRDLILLVENMGRVGFIHLDQQRKGFNGWVINDATGAELTPTWKVYDLGFKKDTIDRLKSPDNRRYWRNINQINLFNQPAFYSAKFTAPTDVTDQFVNFETWDKGAMFVNTVNLGRYWKIGPQKALYLPAPFINQGENELLLFELHKPSDWRVDFQYQPNLG